jgi:hypothetical protein
VDTEVLLEMVVMVEMPLEEEKLEMVEMEETEENHGEVEEPEKEEEEEMEEVSTEDATLVKCFSLVDLIFLK